MPFQLYEQYTLKFLLIKTKLYLYSVK